MNIGQAASVSRISAEMICYYESIDLMASITWSTNNYRACEDSGVHALRFIGRARALGFSMEQIRELLELWGNKRRASATMKAIALQRIQELNTRIAVLTGVRDTLVHLAQHCDDDGHPACPTSDVISNAVPERQLVAHVTRHWGTVRMNDGRPHPYTSSPVPGHIGRDLCAQGGDHQHTIAKQLTLVTATEDRDPVYDMAVKLGTPCQSNYAGARYVFRSAACQKKFKAEPAKYVSTGDEASAAPDAVYTCPMHPGVRQNRLGGCPKYDTMPEPEIPSLDADGNPGLATFHRHFW